MRRVYILFSFLLLMTSCSDQPTQVPTQLISTPIVILTTATPTIASIPMRLTERVGTVLALQTSSSTPLPTHTPIPTLSPIPVDLSNLTSIAQATQRPLFEKNCKTGWYRSFFNKDWGICDLNHKVFVIFSTDGRFWRFSYIDFDMAVADEGNEYYTRVLYWTENGDSVYVAPWPDGYDPAVPFYGNGLALIRIDLTNGRPEFVIPPTGDFYNITFSPTGRQVMYAAFSMPLDLVLQDLQSGEQKHIDIEPRYTQAGEFTWSQDESKLAYKLIMDVDECSRKYTIRVLNMTDMSSTTIIDDTPIYTCQSSDPTYYINEFTGNSIELEQHGDIWVYDIATRQLSLQATATPRP